MSLLSLSTSQFSFRRKAGSKIQMLRMLKICRQKVLETKWIPWMRL
jgi:hypothetical protein